MENMEKELLKLESKELRITSVELVDIINQFREEEFNILKEKALNNELSEKLKKKLNKKDKYTKLRHDSFIAKIKKELETLEALGLSAQQNILLGSYTDKNDQQRPCYNLNRDGMLQMLNSESAIVRAKTIDYINKLEKQLNGKANLLLSIYNGGQNAILASKELTELEVAEAVAPLNKQIEEDKPKVGYYDNVLNPTDFKKLITVTQIAKDLCTTATRLNEKLKILGIQYKQSKTWFLNKQYEYLIKEDYADYVINEFGQTLKWTEKGRQFIIDKLEENNYLNDDGTLK